MIASDVNLSTLTSYSECYAAIDAIESDYRNIQGGIKAWNSGRQTFLKAGAKKKISALVRHASTFDNEDQE